MGVMLQPEIVGRRRVEARERGLSLAKTPCGKFQVGFVLCDTYNYCKCDQSCCVDPLRGSEGIPRSAEEFMQVPVLAAHFVGELYIYIYIYFFYKGGKMTGVKVGENSKKETHSSSFLTLIRKIQHQVTASRASTSATRRSRGAAPWPSSRPWPRSRTRRPSTKMSLAPKA